ncbi:MAG: deoxyribonuclease IV [Candidatus Uhrbacteria bacterium]
MPLIGAHVSMAGGIWNAPANAAAEACECFQLFTRSPRGGKALPLTRDVVARFREQCDVYHQQCWVVHTPYYINLASPDATTRRNSGRIIREELDRASALGALAVMTHLGSAKEVGRERGVTLVIDGLVKALRTYNGTAQFCIEIAARAGAILGDTFEEIATIIEGVERRLPNPSRNGSMKVCFDTQHAFASGYDLRTPRAVNTTLKRFDTTIGLNRLACVHIQDSKVQLGAHRDRHEHIGKGHIGATGLRAFVRHKAMRHLPLILETQTDGRKRDIVALKKFRDV